MVTRELLKFRKLRADEIEARVATCSAKGVSLLLYKDARCDMNILDETVGTTGWQRHHSRDNANCIVALWDNEKSQWIEKEDTGTESFTEKEKGLASDSFKRACFNWGIGRELYTAPFIWIKANDCSDLYLDDKTKKYKCYDRFAVTDISYDEVGKINMLKIKNDKMNRVVYNFSGNSAPAADDYTQEYVSDREKQVFIKRCEQLGQDPQDILRKVGWQYGRMTTEHHGKALILLKEIEEGTNA